MSKRKAVLEFNKQFEKDIAARLVQTDREIAEAIAKGMEIRVPVDEGDLKKSIRVGKEEGRVAVVMDEHGYFVEYGSESGANPTGLSNASNVNSILMGTNGAAIYAPRTWATLQKFKDGDQNPLTVPSIVAALQKLVTNQIPINQTQGTASDASSIYIGAFLNMMIGYTYQPANRIQPICKRRHGRCLEQTASTFPRLPARRCPVCTS